MEPTTIVGISELLNGSERLSWAKKKAENFKWAEERCDAIDHYYPEYYNEERRKRLLLNYDLMNSRGVKTPVFFNPNDSMFREEGITPAAHRLQHHDIITPILRAMSGEQGNRPLVPIVTDSSRQTQNLIKKQREELILNFVSQNFIEPIRQKAFQQYVLENQIQDLYSLTPEQQQQLQSDVNARADAMTPKDLRNAFKKGFRSIREKQLQQLVEFLVHDLDVKFVTDRGFEHGLITGEEVYYVGVRNGKPVLEWVNPLNFISSGAPENTFVEQDDWAKRVKWIKPADVWNRHGSKFTAEDIKKMDAIVAHFGVPNADIADHMASELIGTLSSKELRLADDINLTTRKGQQEYLGFLSMRGGKSHKTIDDNLVRELHVVWKSLRLLKHITRVMPTGQLERFWVDESYRFNPIKGDLKEKRVWVPEVWEVTKVGEIDPIYVNKRPIPYQYRSLKDPYDVKLPYYGALYNKLAGNSENIAPIDRAKIWQHKFNQQMARIDELEATDVGKVILMTLSAKPADWSWGKFIEIMRYSKIVPVDLKKEGIDAFDAQFFKDLDLSNIVDIANRMQYLEQLRQNVAVALSFNDSRLGQQAVSTSVTNNNQNIIRSINQTRTVFSLHDKIVENVLNALANAARIAFKDEGFYARYSLDDLSVAELELDPEVIKDAVIGVKVVIDPEEQNNVDVVKQLMQPMIQNGLITFSDAMKVIWARSKSEIFDIAETREKDRQIEAAEQQEYEQMTMQQQQQVQKDLMVLQNEMKAQLELLNKNTPDVTKISAAQIGATVLERQFDIDGNNQSDLIQQKELEIKQKDKELQSKERLEREKLRLKAQELRIKARESKQKETEKSKSSK